MMTAIEKRIIFFVLFTTHVEEYIIFVIPSFYTKGLEVTYKVYLTLTSGFVEAQFIGFKSFF